MACWLSGERSLPFGLLVLDTQGQLTLYSVARSGQIRTHSSTYICSCYLQAENGSPITAVKKWRHHHSHKAMGYFFRLSRADNSVVGGPIELKFELVQDIMHVLITCKFKMYWINSNREEVEIMFFLDAQWQLTSTLQSVSSDLDQLRTHPSFYAYPHYLQVS